MQWLEVKINTTPTGLDPVSRLVEDLGVTGLVIEDEGDFHDFLEHNHQYWDYVDEELMESKRGICRITFYVSADDEGMDTVKKVYAALGAEDKLRHVEGPEGHRFYKALAWPVFDEITGW